MTNEELWSKKVEVFTRLLEGKSRISESILSNLLFAQLGSVVTVLVRQKLIDEDEFWGLCCEQLDALSANLHHQDVLSPFQLPE